MVRRRLAPDPFVTLGELTDADSGITFCWAFTLRREDPSLNS